MNMYEVECSEEELKILEQATDLGMGILTFDVDEIAPVFNNDNKIVSILKKMKKELFGDKTKEDIQNEFTKETRLRYRHLENIKKKLNDLK